MSGQAPLINERYQLIDRYAVGGAAEIYRAHDHQTGHVVVLKKVRTDIPFDPEVDAGFIREVQLSLLAQHKNVLRGLDSGNVNGSDYVILEYIDGQDLSDVLERAADRDVLIPVPFVLHIVREVLDGLNAIHTLLDHNGNAFGLVHRDLTPRNVFVRYDGEIRVADFGASVATFQEPTPSELVGSPGYLSPEQAKLEPLDGRSDIFAVGCMLYEMIVGAPAFDAAGKSDAALIKMHTKGQIKKIPDSVSEGIRYIIEIATSPDREDRYPTAADMRDSVDQILLEMGAHDVTLGVASMVRSLFAKEFAEDHLRSLR